ncbi:MAG: YitT family protein [Pseudomonadota bacterium]
MSVAPSKTKDAQPILSLFDLQGLVAGTLLCALGLVLLYAAGLVSGQLAGASLLISYVLPVGFGPVFFAVSAPMFLLAWARRGPVFTFRSLGVVAGISTLTPVLSSLIAFEHINPVLAALLGGLCIGIGLIAVFRHNASPGGASILAIVIEDRTGLKAGWFQLAVDAAIFATAFLVLSPGQVALSFLGALVTNLLVAWNFNIRQSGQGTPA